MTILAGGTMDNLTPRTVQLINKFFDEDDRELVMSVIIDESGTNLSLGNEFSTGMERIRFAMIKLSNGELNRLDLAIELAKKDWRDLLVAAGFENDINAHNIWAETILHDSILH